MGSTETPPVQSKPKTSGMAFSSLIFGIVGIVVFMVSSLARWRSFLERLRSVASMKTARIRRTWYRKNCYYRYRGEHRRSC